MLAYFKRCFPLSLRRKNKNENKNTSILVLDEDALSHILVHLNKDHLYMLFMTSKTMQRVGFQAHIYQEQRKRINHCFQVKSIVWRWQISPFYVETSGRCIPVGYIIGSHMSFYMMAKDFRFYPVLVPYMTQRMLLNGRVLVREGHTLLVNQIIYRIDHTTLDCEIIGGIVNFGELMSDDKHVFLHKGVIYNYGYDTIFRKSGDKWVFHKTVPPQHKQFGVGFSHIVWGDYVLFVPNNLSTAVPLCRPCTRDIVFSRIKAYNVAKHEYCTVFPTSGMALKNTGEVNLRTIQSIHRLSANAFLVLQAGSQRIAPIFVLYLSHVHGVVHARWQQIVVPERLSEFVEDTGMPWYIVRSEDDEFIMFILDHGIHRFRHTLIKS